MSEYDEIRANLRLYSVLNSKYIIVLFLKGGKMLVLIFTVVLKLITPPKEQVL